MLYYIEYDFKGSRSYYPVGYCCAAHAYEVIREHGDFFKYTRVIESSTWPEN